MTLPKLELSPEFKEEFKTLSPEDQKAMVEAMAAQLMLTFLKRKTSPSSIAQTPETGDNPVPASSSPDKPKPK